MSRVVIITLACTSAAFGQAYDIERIEGMPESIASWATDVTNNGRVVGLVAVEDGRRTFGFVHRSAQIEQLVVPQAGNFAVFPRRLEIHHHVAVYAMSDGGYYAGTGESVNLGLSSQPFFAWLPSSDPYPDQFLAADDVGNAMIFDIADTADSPTTVGTGSVIIAGQSLRQGFISIVRQSDDVGDPARMTFIRGFGGAPGPSSANAINASGSVVGYAANPQRVHRAFIRHAADGVLIDLGTLGGPSAEASGISNAGHIVGHADVSSGTPHAFLIAPGGGAGSMVDLGTLGGATSCAHGVNNDGVAVGNSWTADGIASACVWRDGVIADLNDLIAPNSGWHLTHASAVNDAGVIVGWGMYEGRSRAFVLTPRECPGDVTGDCHIDLVDLALLLRSFGVCAGTPGFDADSDFDNSGCVELPDLAVLLSGFGT